MAIPNELSSDIAAALLTRQNRSKSELKELKEVLVNIHSTLQQMTYDQQQESPREIARPAKVAKSD